MNVSAGEFMAENFPSSGAANNFVIQTSFFSVKQTFLAAARL